MSTDEFMLLEEQTYDVITKLHLLAKSSSQAPPTTQVKDVDKQTQEKGWAIRN